MKAHRHDARLPEPQAAPADGERAAVVSKAVVRAAAALALSQAQLAVVLGLSPATISRLCGGSWRLDPATKAYELAVLLVRLYRALDSITGDDESSRSWLRAPNTALGAVPADLIRTVSGLVETIAYVDSRRAPL